MVELPTDAEPVRVVEGDALAVARSLPAGAVAAVVTDPPYGIDLNTDYGRFSGGRKSARRQRHKPIAGDAEPFDPAPWLGYPKAVLWGYHCFASRLPMGTVLVWQKKPDAKLGKFLSDCELAWVKSGHGVYLFKHHWDGVCRASEAGTHFHPSQKPVALMRWCLQRLRLPPGSLVLDPYAGSGPVGVACASLGLRCLMVEQEPAYVAVARRRVSEAMGAGISAGAV